MSEVKLKPCPFCGGDAEIKAAPYAEDGVDTWVECGSCFARTDAVEAAYTEATAAAVGWNQRTPPHPDAAPEGSVRCTCEWAHPVDGSVRDDWPAETDPYCEVHAVRGEQPQPDEGGEDG